MILENKKVLITGGFGFIGKNIADELRTRGYKNITQTGSKDYDLREQKQVRIMLEEQEPDVIFHLAALVGGIWANATMKGKFFYENVMMSTMLMEEARTRGVEKILLAGSGCIYPKYAPQPIKEEYLWDGYPEETNAPYAFAKRMLIIQSQAYEEQYGFNSVTVMPGNVYGPYDNFHPEHSHLIPALIKKFVHAVNNDEKEVILWGDGSPTRDFVYSRDLAKFMVSLMERHNGSEPINVSSGVETPIHEAARIVARLTGFQGEVLWDASRPNGQPRRWFDTSYLESILGETPCTDLEDGLKATIKWYTDNIGIARSDEK